MYTRPEFIMYINFDHKIFYCLISGVFNSVFSFCAFLGIFYSPSLKCFRYHFDDHIAQQSIRIIYIQRLHAYRVRIYCKLNLPFNLPFEFSVYSDLLATFPCHSKFPIFIVFDNMIKTELDHKPKNATQNNV